MAKQLTDKNDIKIFILYLLKNIERPVDMITLNDIVVQDGFVNQFDFMDCFYELCDTSAVRKSEKDGVELYEITGEGSVAAETMQSNIIQSIRERSLRSAMRLLSFHGRGAKHSCTLEDADDGRCRRVCRFTDKNGEFFSLSVLFETRHQAELMKYNCGEDPELLYRGVLSILSGDINYLADAWAGDVEYDGEEENP